MGDQKIFDYHEESQSEKLARKSKETPIFPVAIALCVGAVGFGAYKFNKRGNMSPSVFLMQLRVGAQGLAVGALTVGLAYSMINEYVLKKK
ncbi:PREDICTED: HIG1 domain family member 1A, mitochondrial isoform X2 [Nicrophorus vespilloides]|nr:PREDICTED: HIG1 domain family member 1A, mitochondrial isoform X2 [Nicrophorus vespilloides]